MNNNEATPNAANPGEMPDPRPGLSVATNAVQTLLAKVTTNDFGKPTPCDEFNVQGLLDHITMVLRRSVAIGTRAHWTTVEQVEVGPDIETYTAEIAAAASAQELAWDDPARLGAVVEVPWGQIPGGAAVAIYTAELATHGWDLATAIGQDFTIPDGALNVALFAVKQIPAEGRDNPEVPFGEVVDPGPDASSLLKIAGWGGRQVI
eukprot:XP_019923839.1 PREDICTED: uncharacterized protein LOC109619049 [Crassostrea gigas]